MPSQPENLCFEAAVGFQEPLSWRMTTAAAAGSFGTALVGGGAGT